MARYNIVVDTDVVLTELDTTSLWDFVSFMYPDYSRSDEIFYNDKLQMIVDSEEQNSESAVRILEEDFEGDRKAAGIALAISNEDIYNKSLSVFMSSIVKIEKI